MITLYFIFSYGRYYVCLYTMRH